MSEHDDSKKSGDGGSDFFGALKSFGVKAGFVAPDPDQATDVPKIHPTTVQPIVMSRVPMTHTSSTGTAQANPEIVKTIQTAVQQAGLSNIFHFADMFRELKKEGLDNRSAAIATFAALKRSGITKELILSELSRLDPVLAAESVRSAQEMDQAGAEEMTKLQSFIENCTAAIQKSRAAIEKATNDMTLAENERTKAISDQEDVRRRVGMAKAEFDASMDAFKGEINSLRAAATAGNTSQEHS